MPLNGDITDEIMWFLAILNFLVIPTLAALVGSIAATVGRSGVAGGSIGGRVGVAAGLFGLLGAWVSGTLFDLYAQSHYTDNLNPPIALLDFYTSNPDHQIGVWLFTVLAVDLVAIIATVAIISRKNHIARR